MVSHVYKSQSFLDPAQAGQLADTAARIFSNEAASLRGAMGRDGTDMQPPEACTGGLHLDCSADPLTGDIGVKSERGSRSAPRWRWETGQGPSETPGRLTTRWRKEHRLGTDAEGRCAP